MVPSKIKVTGGVGTNGTSDRAFGGGLEGASQLSREMALWAPDLRPADALINPAKDLLDGRSREMVLNDGFVGSATDLTKDSIVGSQYVLNAQPNWELLGADEAWAEEFQRVVEGRFNAIATSDAHWLDAQRVKSFTDIVRLAVGSYVMTGEVLASAEWVRQANRPCATAVQMVSPSRLSNPYDGQDTDNIRRGVVRDAYGAPQAYFIRNKHQYDPYTSADNYRWTRVDAYLPWGRPQILHIYEQIDPDQSRGVAAMVSVLKEMKMTKQYRDIVLQNAVVNSMYAAAIESELPADVVFGQLGANQDPENSVVGNYMSQLLAYTGEAKGIRLNGAKIPHLFPGTKLKMQPAGDIGDVKFENSLLRHLASAFGLSYEEFSRDFTQTNYSSARASMMMSWRHMTAKKRKAADGIANFVYGLWLEEEIGAGRVPLPAGKTRAHFYEPLMREAYTACDWIGAARGQIDEGKETAAAAERLANNLTTLEDELGRLGKDWRKVLPQRAREKALLDKLGLTPVQVMSAKPVQPPADPLPGDPNA